MTMMKYVAFSTPIIYNVRHFLSVKKITRLEVLKYFFSKATFVGWGRKRSGRLAVILARLTRNPFLLLESGFIRSVGLGESESFSLIQDDIGIYYDATAPSRLEEILNHYDFESDQELMTLAREAKEKILRYKISKYNNAPQSKLDFLNSDTKKVLIVAQTQGDSSLEYGYGYRYSTDTMIKEAIEENPGYEIYLKIHPEVLSGDKLSDIHIDELPPQCKILTDNINPFDLMEQFEKIYTKTSGMGMEALLMGKEVYCYGLPYYAGWGLTVDKIEAPRRGRKLSVDELFAGAYILYTSYYNPCTKSKSDIMDTIETIYQQKRQVHAGEKQQNSL